ncbi:MAG: hypothetical protein R2941_25000 [Desulfobacterales bacterium]
MDEVHYISGELLGNAVKFSYDPEFRLKFASFVMTRSCFYASNSVRPNDLQKISVFYQTVAREDPAEYFLEQMEKSAAEDSTESGVGFLTLINDYGVNLSWKFEEKRLEQTFLPRWQECQLYVTNNTEGKNRRGAQGDKYSISYQSETGTVRCVRAFLSERQRRL